ncbi:MAG: hypothetical protein KKB50_10385 [Planctomycetes bacterium]|nr:hypothetical protein [Planctomycetota bacterium]
MGTVPNEATRVYVGWCSAEPQPDGTYYVANVPLVVGDNSLEVVATKGDREVLTAQVLTVTCTADTDPVRLTVSPRNLAEGDRCLASIESAVPVDAVLWDLDGDGEYDETTQGLSIEHGYAEPGKYSVFATVRTADGLHHSSLAFDPQADVFVALRPQVVNAVELGVAHDLEVRDDGSLWVLSGSNLVQFDFDLAESARVALPAGTQPSGFTVDGDGAFVVAEAATGQVSRLLPTGELDAGFGDNGKLLLLDADSGAPIEPTDVVVDEEAQLYAVDRVSGSLFRFESDGWSTWRAALEEPGRFVAHSNGGFHVVEGGCALRVFDRSGTRRMVFDLPTSACQAAQPCTHVRLILSVDDGGSAYLTDSSNRVARVIETGVTAVLKAAAIPDPAGLALLLLTTDGRVVKVVVPEEAPDNAPLARWNAFLGHLRAGNHEAALDYVHPQERPVLAPLLGDRALEELRSYAERFGSSKFISRGTQRARFLVEFEGAAVPVDIVFRRELRSTEWFLTSF